MPRDDGRPEGIAAPGPATSTTTATANRPQGQTHPTAESGVVRALDRRRARQYAAAFERYRPDPRPDPRVDTPITPQVVDSWLCAVAHLRAHGYDVRWCVPQQVRDQLRRAA